MPVHRCISLCTESYASVRVIVASVVIGGPERMSLTWGLELRGSGTGRGPCCCSHDGISGHELRVCPHTAFGIQQRYWHASCIMYAVTRLRFAPVAPAGGGARDSRIQVSVAVLTYSGALAFKFAPRTPARPDPLHPPLLLPSPIAHRARVDHKCGKRREQGGPPAQYITQ